jgi:indoleacetamide hydrolase
MRFRGSEWCVTQFELIAELRARYQYDECHINRRDLLKAAALATGAATMSVGQSRAAVRPNDALALTATEAVAAIRRGDITAEAYAKALLARAEAFKHLNACIVLNRSGLLAAARAVDIERRKGGRLGGSPASRFS